uniref:Uncharacterized protein n=1 Tax=Steinernema glaseri TaxID=37863 RepID=A0A1I7ZGA0_9BILA
MYGMFQVITLDGSRSSLLLLPCLSPLK